jgi:hypothetical protein
MMDPSGRSVVHLYIMFIIGCFIYAGWGVYSHINYLEETVDMQSRAISAKEVEVYHLRQYIANQQYYMYNTPGLGPNPHQPKLSNPLN